MERIARKVRVLRGLARANDIAHKWVVVPFILLGQVFVGAFWHTAFLALVIGLQLAFRDCPLTLLSHRLRTATLKDGEERRSGRVRLLYQKLGGWAVLPIAAYLFLIAFLIGAILAP